MKLKWRNILFIFGMFVLVILLMDFSRRMDKLVELTKQYESVRAEATAVMQTQASLLAQVTYSSSEDSVEEWAYQDGKWVRPGEKLVEIIPSGDATPTPGSSDPQLDENPPKWRIWWELFFGDKP
jgi:cell division protein FtsB